MNCYDIQEAILAFLDEMHTSVLQREIDGCPKALRINESIEVPAVEIERDNSVYCSLASFP